MTSAFVGPAGGLFGGRGAVVDLTGSTVAAMVVKAPVVAYKPSKGPETNPEIAPILKRGLRYLDEFATPGGAS